MSGDFKRIPKKSEVREFLLIATMRALMLKIKVNFYILKHKSCVFELISKHTAFIWSIFLNWTQILAFLQKKQGHDVQFSLVFPVEANENTHRKINPVPTMRTIRHDNLENLFFYS